MYIPRYGVIWRQIALFSAGTVNYRNSSKILVWDPGIIETETEYQLTPYIYSQLTLGRYMLVMAPENIVRKNHILKPAEASFEVR
jgi:hypothetical protein